MKKAFAASMLFTALALGSGAGNAQGKSDYGPASEGRPGTTRPDPISGGDLGSGRYTEVEWTYSNAKGAYVSRFAAAGAEDTVVICTRRGGDGAKSWNAELGPMVVMSGGATAALSRLKDIAAQDRVCKVAGRNARGLSAKEPFALDYLIITRTD